MATDSTAVERGRAFHEAVFGLMATREDDVRMLGVVADHMRRHESPLCAKDLERLRGKLYRLAPPEPALHEAAEFTLAPTTVESFGPSSPEDPTKGWEPLSSAPMDGITVTITDGNGNPPQPGVDYTYQPPRNYSNDRYTLRDAAIQVERWWLDHGMHQLGLAPACMFLLREVLARPPIADAEDTLRKLRAAQAALEVHEGELRRLATYTRHNAGMKDSRRRHSEHAQLQRDTIRNLLR